ncbi:MAG: S24 family peptidase [Terriglobia bacterium]
MMQDWSFKVKELRRALGFSQSQLAEQIGMNNKKNVADWEQGSREPAPQRYAQLARLAPADPEASGLAAWFYRRLLERVGADPRRLTAALAVAGREALPVPELKIVSLEEWSERFRALERLDYYVPLPLLKDEAAAGTPREISERDLDGFALIYYAWCPNPANFTCVRVRGDSMSPILNDGAIVAIDHAQRDPALLRHRMVAARHEDGVTIKWLEQDSSGQLLLIPENKQYPPLALPRTQANPIVGMIAWWWNRQR